METGEFEQPFKNEAEVVRQYLPVFTEIKEGRKCEVKGITGKSENNDVSRAWRIILTPSEIQSDASMAAIFDWDDTLEPYTVRKDRLYRDYLSLIPSVDAQVKEKFLKACYALNQAARVLPPTGIHPERYAPLLELMATSVLIDYINQGEIPSLLPEAEIGSDELEELARKFIKQNILPGLSGALEVKAEQRNGQFKEYFLEKNLQATSVNFGQKPEQVGEDVWNLYKKHLTEVNIPIDELEHFDLPENVRFFVSSFGEADFQLEKIKNAFLFLKDHGQRLPDEIILFTRGRKDPIIRKIISSLPRTQFVYIDDSPRQLESLSGTPRLILFHAQREESQRSREKAQGIGEVNMETLKMSEIVNLAGMAN